MKIKIMLILLFCISFSIPVFALTEVGSCGTTLSTAGETYVLNKSLLSQSIDCITVAANNIIFDMDEKTIQGDGIHYGIIVSAQYNNMTIKNGYLDNWNTALYYHREASSVATSNYFENIAITNSTNQSIHLYYYFGTGKPNSFYFRNLTLDNKGNLTFRGNNIVKFEGESNIDAGQLYTNNINQLQINTTSPPQFETINMTTTFTYTNYAENDFIYVKNLCSSDLFAIPNLKIKMTQDQTGITDTCVYGRNLKSMILDFDGHTIQGTSANYGIHLSGLVDNTSIQNVNLNNWGIGIYYNTSESLATDITTYLNNITITNSNDHALYLRYLFGTNRRNTFIINNIDINDSNIYLRGHDEVQFNGGDIDAQDFTIDYTTKLVFNLSEPPQFDTINIVEAFTYENPREDNHILINNICDSTLKSVNNFFIKISQDQTGIASNCFTASGLKNMVIDFNGHTIQGTGTNYGFNLAGDMDNTTIKNAVIDNWNRSIHYYHSSCSISANTYLENITTTNSTSYALYLEYVWGGAKCENFQITNFNANDGNIFIKGISTVSFQETLTNPKNIALNNINTLSFNTTQPPEFETINMVTTFGYQNHADDKNILLKNICGSTIKSVNNFFIKISQDQTGITSNCFTASGIKNMVIDFNGHTIQGTGANYGLNLAGDMDNTTIRNAIIDNFDRGIHYYHSSCSISADTYLDNITLTNNPGYSLFLDYTWSSDKCENFYISNSYFEDNISIDSLSKAIFYGNNFTTGALFTTVTNMGNFSKNPTLNGSPIGNFWQDFNCGNESNFYNVEYNGYNYTICNENDYTTGTTDTAPLIGIQKPTSQQPSQNSNNNLPRSSIMPFYNLTSIIISATIIIITIMLS